MQLKLSNVRVELSGEPILKTVDFDVTDNAKIAVVGRNGSGKTTLLKLISGEYSPANREGEDFVYAVSGKPRIGVLSQMTFDDENVSLVEEIRSAYSDVLEMKSKLDQAERAMTDNPTDANIKKYTSLLDVFENNEGFYFEREYESAIKKFGFSESERLKPISDFSGGQRTKIAFLKLVLSKPDILLLDEPTNHLDIDAVEWLEEYLKKYKKSFVVVSHDRMFLDNVVNVVYEIEHGKTHKYNGNYSDFVVAKRALRELQGKQYEAHKKELERLGDLVDRFRYKATKAAMAQSKLKQIERMGEMEKPETYDTRTFKADFEPDDLGVKDALIVTDLKIGYDKVLSTVNLKVERGARIGIIGGNGLGKSTFLKTIVGKINALGGECKIGARVSIGYFDQQMAKYSCPHTVLEDFMNAFPRLNDYEARSALGAFNFSGEEVFKPVNVLSGGERVRLALCKIFKTKPNFLILDEPTNHMDIIGKETLEEMLSNYAGTLLFVSHDRYFIKKIANSLLSFEQDGVEFYQFGYEQYLTKKNTPAPQPVKQEEKHVKIKKEYSTPLKEKSRIERAIAKAEGKISELEEKINALNTEYYGGGITDYVKLNEMQMEISALQTELDGAMSEWERLSEDYSKLISQ